MKRLGLLIALSALVGCSTSPGPNTGSVRRELNVCAAGPTLPGIDVSKWQGVIDWDQVAAAGIGRELGKLFLGTFSPAGWAAGLMAMKTAAEEMATTLAEMPPED